MNSLDTNPLSNTFDEAPFSSLKNEHFLPAIQQAIFQKKEEIQKIITNKDIPTFQNTVAALDYAGEQLSRVTSVFFNLNSAETNEDIQKIAQEVSPLLAELSNDISLNEALFRRIKTVFDQKDQLDLTPEEQTLLEKNYKSFVRNGALLPEDAKEKLRKIDKELSQLGLKFGENVLAATNNFELLITDEKDLNGLPEGAKEAAKALASSKDKEGWLITLDYPSYIPFMKYADNRDLRKKLSIAFGSKCYQDAFDNQENVLKIVNLRYQRAQLLGYSSHAHYVLEERMAKNPASVQAFLSDLLEKSKPAAEKEFQQLQQFAQELDQIDQLQKWDSAYYAEKLKQEKYALDDEVLKPYFELENVIDGVFQVASRLFQLQFKEITTIDTYHKEVKTYQVLDKNGDFMALFYADFHPRAGKRNGAWMTSYKTQMQKEGINSRPHISIVCNFTKPTPTKPSLLTFNEVTTLFHEFGHALHGILANTTYPGLSGTSVYWDFVELPSQILENWCYEKEALELFAKHYQTGETIPMELIDKIKKSSTFMEGMATLRQLSFGFLDMAWHAGNPEGIKDVKKQENEVFKQTDLFPEVPQTCMSTSFSHIFQGGYSSGYYSYKWAEVLDADAFDYFQENGIFDKDTATKFKDHILSKGGTEDPMQLYKRFRGKEPKPEALLKRAGLI
ncbi:M3 family metallopeptidase [Aquimarina sp. ERC-38]|uniref:M3 family metallopeptidase n=1 Tax=Aquimarina sp. ERC-38 TaxID=2949996 RepID=UPI0022478A66|nr:M3 family metallopeptidase [Aquimarina sp. ERC-38]UZO82464.1 M3 family metallopeptidase [Aquimarina sp. ERC-38]